MMIRSTRIPSILNRIVCDTNNNSNGFSGGILYALLVTTDGELLGVSNKHQHPQQYQQPNPDAFGTLIADIALDYHRLGEELINVDHNNNQNNNNTVTRGSYIECILMEMELGLVGVTYCAVAGCFIIAVGTIQTPLGYMKDRLQSLNSMIEESFTSIVTTTTTTTTTRVVS